MSQLETLKIYGNAEILMTPRKSDIYVEEYYLYLGLNLSECQGIKVDLLAGNIVCILKLS